MKMSFFYHLQLFTLIFEIFYLCCVQLHHGMDVNGLIFVFVVSLRRILNYKQYNVPICVYLSTTRATHSNVYCVCSIVQSAALNAYVR